MPVRRVTLRDIAGKAGVSHTTVMRAINGSPTIAADTRKEILQLAEKMGYRPDPVLSALASYRKTDGRRQGNVLAFVDCDGSEHSGKVLEGAQGQAGLLGYRIDRFALPATAKAQSALSRQLFHRGVRGLLFGPAGRSRQFEGWDWKHFACVSLGALSHEPAFDAISMDYFRAAFSAVELLRSSGAERVGLVVDPVLQVRTGNRWLGGCLAADRSVAVFDSPAHTARRLRPWCREHRIQGIVTVHHEVHAAVDGLNLSIAFLNNFDCPPGLPRLVLDPKRIGVEGVRVLHHALLRGEYDLPREPRMIFLEGVWASE
jgi:LacI family transcriptional regulator